MMIRTVTKHAPTAIALLAGFVVAIVFAPVVLATADWYARWDEEHYPVGITIISRPWILRGIYGDKVAVSAYYDCDDRIIKAPLLTGDVPEFKP